MSARALSLADVEAAAQRIAGVARHTPVVTSSSLDAELGASVFIKAENFQRTGSFKFRGAFNTVSQLTDDERARGVCSVSSGNHAQALALAAQLHGVRAVIWMPEDAPANKAVATEAYGAEVVRYDRYAVKPHHVRDQLIADSAMTYVSSHDDARMAAGAGTALLELLADVGPLDMLIAPIGGGGGMAGYATVMRERCPAATVVGAEPDASRLASRSLAAGRRVEIDVPHTIADGQQLAVLGEFTFEVMRDCVDVVVPVTDAEIVDAMRFYFERCKIVAEPSGAIALAAARKGNVETSAKRVGVILSGGNTTVGRFASLCTVTE